jgi:hypothetical protein
MRKNLYDSDKLIIIIHEAQHKYQAMFIGKALSFCKDVIVPIPRWKHYHMFEHDNLPAMWNNWFMDGNKNWLEYGWHKNLDFAQKQGYLNTYRTPEVDTFLESKKYGVMTIQVNNANAQATLTELCLIFPRAKFVALATNFKLKTPFGFNTLHKVDPLEISPVETSWQHGMANWISNRQMSIRSVSQALGLSLNQSECQALFNQAGAHLPGYKSSGYWGRWHSLRMTLEPEAMAMFNLKVDGITIAQEKIKSETEYYYELNGAQQNCVIHVEQFNQSHADLFNPIHITQFDINDQDILFGGTFYPKPPQQILFNYKPKDLLPKKIPNVMCDGYWEVKTNGVNVLT